MKKPIILRKRFIPMETIDISGDELLFRDDDLIITRWKAIKPRVDFSTGVSCTFLKEGYKISRFYDQEGKFLYWYCDIIDVVFNEDRDEYIFVDLLVDIKMMPEGSPDILDLDELAEALESGFISQEQCCRALRNVNVLLKKIKEGRFPPEAFKECL